MGQGKTSKWSRSVKGVSNGYGKDDGDDDDDDDDDDGHVLEKYNENNDVHHSCSSWE